MSMEEVFNKSYPIQGETRKAAGLPISTNRCIGRMKRQTAGQRIQQITQCICELILTWTGNGNDVKAEGKPVLVNKVGQTQITQTE